MEETDDMAGERSSSHIHSTFSRGDCGETSEMTARCATGEGGA